MNRNLVAIIIGVMSLGLFVVAAIFITPQTNYSDAKISEEDYQKIITTHEYTDKKLTKNLRFNGEKIYYASKNNTWYYSIVEKQNNAYNPTIKFEDGKNLKIAFKNSQDINAKNIESGTPLDFVVYDNDNYHEYQLAITTLPIISISHEDEILKESDVEISFELFDNREKTLKRVTKTGGKIHIRGSSTGELPKKSYRLNLRQKSPGEHDRNANEPLLGMREDDDWILYSAYSDHERLRNNLNENLWYETSQDNQNVNHATGVEAKWVELIDNGKYAGLYGLSTTIDEKSLGIQKNSNDKYENYIVKKAHWDDTPVELNSNPISHPYELKTDKVDDEEYANQTIRNYLFKSMALKDTAYIKKTTDLSSLIDVSLYANLTLDTDKVCSALGCNYKNMYIINMNTKAGEKYVYVPWDFDATWGNFWKDNPYNIPVATIVADESFISATLRKNDEQYRQDELNRYKELRKTHWSNEHILELINKQETDIFKSGAYARDIEAWPDSAKIDDQSNWNLDYFRKYVQKRLEYLDYYYGLRDSEPDPLPEEGDCIFLQNDVQYISCKTIR